MNLSRKENSITLLYNIKGGSIEGESAQNFKWGSEYELIEKTITVKFTSGVTTTQKNYIGRYFKMALLRNLKAMA